MFKKIKRYIDICKESYLCAKELRQNSFATYTKADLDLSHKYNTLIYVNNVVVRGQGLMLALVDSNMNIWVDNEFMSLEDDVKEFIIEHEKSHIELGHLEAQLTGNYALKRSLGYKDLVQREFEADKLTYEKIGYAKTLKGLLAIRELSIGKRPRKEATRRINYIMDVEKGIK